MLRTVVITPPEPQALERIRPRHAAGAQVRRSGHCVDIAAMGERQMAAGVSGALIPFEH